ncbi:hypothetical protein ESZ36_00120 [Colwellia demingiae]|uniref:Multicopper oxidase domain-containing protein n=1 Tax=Colwellia demingiae TaxID=89401 RepID=A0A5C6QST8_9GAMM|nr:multicopper oxidase domain-containing protein [Colwellia demingiae]TWX71680.1 hypothetical protein ESZ36_00120 [Colwellia demingiae]
MISRRNFVKNVSLGSLSLIVLGCGGKNKGKTSIGANPPIPKNLTTNNKLFVPPLIDTRNTTTDIWIRNSEANILDSTLTNTYSYNTAVDSLGLLGPTLLMERNMTSSLNFINELGVETTAHQHGLHVSGMNDGGPQSRILPGKSRTNVLEIDQPAGTHWYHPHPHGNTGEQVIKGLAGLIIIQDPEEINSLPNLPRSYGVNDFPIIIQDKSFNTDGSIQYDAQKSYGKRGYLGDSILVNGQIQPDVSVPLGWIRLRILNGSNARFYERGDSLSFSNQQQFYVIASDGGLLSEPVSTTSLPIGPGERYEIMLNMNQNQQLDLMVGNRNILSLVADLNTYDNSQALLPTVLANVPKALNQKNNVTRTFKLSENMTINGKKMNMQVIDEQVPLGITEVWRIFGKGARHTFHVHGCSFLVINRDNSEVPLWEKGWKDTIIISGKRPVEILVKINKTADRTAPFMYHCHMLEHEDMGMMGQFTVA